jgi:hypothetical protein
MHRPHRPPRQNNPARSAIEHLQIVTFRKMADQSPLVWGFYENFYSRGFAVEPYYAPAHPAADFLKRGNATEGLDIAIQKSACRGQICGKLRAFSCGDGSI